MDKWEMLDSHENIITSYYDKINNNNYQQILSEIYNYIKSITNYYYNNNEISEMYKFLKTDVLFAEKKIGNKDKILNVPTRFDDLDQDNLLEYIVYQTRNYLSLMHQLPIDNLDLSNDCYKASKHIKKLCKENNITCYTVPIYPGYDKCANLYDGNGYHFASIIKYQGKYYLVDVTYSQFFYTVRNNFSQVA